MKDNKSPGVDGILPKLLMEIIEQINTSLARVFNLSLKEGVVLFEWKEANIIPLFKSVVSCAWDCSKYFTFHPLVDMFIPMPFRLLWEH